MSRNPRRDLQAKRRRQRRQAQWQATYEPIDLAKITTALEWVTAMLPDLIKAMVEQMNAAMKTVGQLCERIRNEPALQQEIVARLGAERARRVLSMVGVTWESAEPTPCPSYVPVEWERRP